jgi:hypothetical protein
VADAFGGLAQLTGGGLMRLRLSDVAHWTDDEWDRHELRAMPHTRAKYERLIIRGRARGVKPETIRRHQRMIEYCGCREQELRHKFHLDDRSEITICG